jgi:hypothetical protein
MTDALVAMHAKLVGWATEKVAANAHPVFNVAAYVDKCKASAVDVGALAENEQVLKCMF